MNTNTHPAMTMTVPALHALIKDFAGKGFTPSVNINTKTKKVDLQMAVMDLEKQEAKVAKKAAPRRGAHADCDHETTKAARAKCRRTRAAEAIAGDQVEAASKGKKGRKLHAVAS